MLDRILRQAGGRPALIGTVTHRIGSSVYEAVNTTPGREVLEGYLREAERQNLDSVIMEVSSHALMQGRADEVPIRYAAFLNLTQDHLDYHRTMEAYYAAKKKLFDFKTLFTAIIHIDDPYGERLAEELAAEKPFRILTFTLEEKEHATFQAKVLSAGFDGSRFELSYPKPSEGRVDSLEFFLPRPGRHHIVDAVCATALAFAAGGSRMIKTARDALTDFPGAPGRFEVLRSETKNLIAICDYAHTPDALENLLRTVQEIRESSIRNKRGRIITVFGCGGDRDKGKRPFMGRIAGRMSDYTIITSDNPRNEDPLDIIGEIEEGIYETAAGYSVTADRRSAITRAVMLARPGDIIVVAGKGHETYQIVGNRKKHFDDREVLKELL